MDAALVVITLLSLGLTAALVVYATRLQREAEQRSEARVVALAADLRRSAGHDHPGVAHDVSPRTATRPPGADDSGHVALFRVQPETGTPRIEVDDFRRTVEARPDLPGGRPDSPPAPSRGLFARDEPDDSSWRRFGGFVLGGAALVLVLAAVFLGSGGSRAEAPPTAAGALATAAGAPLELVALRHDRAGSTLTISGVVRNPRGGPERKGVAAVVFLFDRDGSFLSSGRAQLDYQALAGGDESPFAVILPGAGDVGRYRVSFRSEHAIVPHVDRRVTGSESDTRAAQLAKP